MKKRMLFVFASIILSFSAVAANQKQVLIPFKSDTLDIYGFKDSITDKIIIPAQFAKVSSFNDGLAAVNVGGTTEIDEENDRVYLEGGQWGFINPEGKFVIPAKYESVSPFSNGTAIVEGVPELDSMYRYGLINTKGGYVIPLMYEDLSSIDDNLYYATKNNLQGIIDNAGKVCIPLQYENIECYNGFAIVKKDTLEGIIKMNNTLVVPIQNSSISLEDNKKFYRIYNKGVYPYFYHISGLKFDSKDEIDTTLSVVSVAGKYGIVDNDAHIILPLKYDRIDRFLFGKFTLAYQNGKAGFISNTGVETVPCKYDYLSNFTDGVALAEIDKKKGYIDTLGNVRIPLIYDEMYVFKGNKKLDKVLLNGKYGLINSSEGKVLVPPIYDYIEPYSDDFVESYLGGVLTSRKTIHGAKFGLISMNGEELFPAKYDFIGAFNEDRALVIKDGVTDSTTGLFLSGNYGFINKKGEEVIPLIYSKAEAFSNGMSNVTLNGTQIVIRPDGKKWVKSYPNISEAICAGDYDAILDFLDKGVDLNKTYHCDCWISNEDGTPVQLLLWKRQPYEYEMLGLFLKKGLDLSKMNSDMLPEIDYRYDIIKLLLDNGYDVNKKGYQGRTLLYNVVKNLYRSDKMLDIVKLLFEYKADAKIVDEYNMTPMDALALCADNSAVLPCAQLLLDYGVDVSLKNSDGFTALDYAKREKASKELQALLKKAEKKK